MYISRVNLQESCFDAFAIENAPLDNEVLCSYLDISYSCESSRLFRDGGRKVARRNSDINHQATERRRQEQSLLVNETFVEDQGR